MDTVTTPVRPTMHGSIGRDSPCDRAAADACCLELFAAALVAADVAVLLIGVIARYLFRSPLMWTDELAQAVFLWLGMIGAIIALNRGEHMRMTALVVRATLAAGDRA